MKNSITIFLFLFSIIVSTPLPVARKQEVERIRNLWDLN